MVDDFGLSMNFVIYTCTISLRPYMLTDQDYVKHLDFKVLPCRSGASSGRANELNPRGCNEG